MSDLKVELHRTLTVSRSLMVASLHGISEYDRRRPMTPTEHVYLGESFGRPAPDRLPWVEDGSVWEDADMWATPDESSEHLLSLYRRACTHGDETVAALELSTPGSVAHWPSERRSTTLGVLLVRMVDETAHHAGHADILREMVDGQVAPDTAGKRTAAEWRDHVARIQEAAEAFAPPQ